MNYFWIWWWKLIVFKLSEWECVGKDFFNVNLGYFWWMEGYVDVENLINNVYCINIVG